MAMARCISKFSKKLNPISNTNLNIIPSLNYPNPNLIHCHSYCSQTVLSSTPKKSEIWKWVVSKASDENAQSRFKSYYSNAMIVVGHGLGVFAVFMYFKNKNIDMERKILFERTVTEFDKAKKDLKEMVDKFVERVKALEEMLENKTKEMVEIVRSLKEGSGAPAAEKKEIGEVKKNN